ncbi:methyltransferase domain-containing protein [Occultella glacieicola]|uniref:Methyltransferase domain-containing protein n=1 Tax=Occultella glacieicola TaxID=2518684 RepID=A0ABY2E1G4_9MICO|nr:methyltransferase domain-containing protein [Occultella glacieicola]TDE90017.1 methyltransferase domain-containing protein [Occultella glacieicola]
MTAVESAGGLEADALDLYYARMSASIGDKAEMVRHVRPGRALDVGCGSGELLDVLAAAGHEVVGLDPAPESVRRAGARNVHLAYADEAAEVCGPHSLDTVVCSSVLHEVFSYGNADAVVGRESSVSAALVAFRRALVPGGRLIVRDGVMPAPGPARIRVDEPGAVERFLRHSPFRRGHGTDREIHLEQVGPDAFEGEFSSAMEFAFTYTWGERSFAREVREFYGVFRLAEYARFVQAHGFRLVCAREYVQPGYRDHLAGRVSFDRDFPASNGLWVYEVDGGAGRERTVARIGPRQGL